MKRILSFLAVAVLLSGTAWAQVEMGKTKSSIMGKGKIIGEMPNELILDNFNINLILYAYGEDQGGGMGSTTTATVGVRTHLTNVDEELAQSMVDEAYEYFVSKWSERGVTVKSVPKEEIEGSKKYSKQAKKGNASITNGGVWDNVAKKNHNMMAWPNGANVASAGTGPTAVQGTFQVMLMDLLSSDPGYTNFNSQVDFISFKTAKLGTTARVEPKPKLVVSNNMSAGAWSKNKTGAYIGGNSAEGIEEYFSDLQTEGFDFLGTSTNDWNYIADKDKYRANVMEMIKKGMDDLFADFDTVKAENTK
jgi:hypothetical protein